MRRSATCGSPAQRARAVAGAAAARSSASSASQRRASAAVARRSSSRPRGRGGSAAAPGQRGSRRICPAHRRWWRSARDPGRGRRAPRNRPAAGRSSIDAQGTARTAGPPAPATPATARTLDVVDQPRRLRGMRRDRPTLRRKLRHDVEAKAAGRPGSSGSSPIGKPGIGCAKPRPQTGYSSTGGPPNRAARRCATAAQALWSACGSCAQLARMAPGLQLEQGQQLCHARLDLRGRTAIGQPEVEQPTPAAGRARPRRCRAPRCAAWPGGAAEQAAEPGCDAAPSVSTATSGAAPATESAAMSPPQPSNSSSGCGARISAGAAARRRAADTASSGSKHLREGEARGPAGIGSMGAKSARKTGGAPPSNPAKGRKASGHLLFAGVAPARSRNVMNLAAARSAGIRVPKGLSAFGGLARRREVWRGAEPLSKTFPPRERADQARSVADLPASAARISRAASGQGAVRRGLTEIGRKVARDPLHRGSGRRKADPTERCTGRMSSSAARSTAVRARLA